MIQTRIVQTNQGIMIIIIMVSFDCNHQNPSVFSIFVLLLAVFILETHNPPGMNLFKQFSPSDYAFHEDGGKTN